MQFFNQKEEVIDIQLTQFGKRLLSQGKFKPTYYAFYDNDILYDLNYANASGSYKETQNQTEKRILKETPRLKTQYMFESSMRPAEMQWIGKSDPSQYHTHWASQQDYYDDWKSMNPGEPYNMAYHKSLLENYENKDPKDGTHDGTYGMDYGTAGENPYGYIAAGGELQLTFDRNYSLGMPIGTMKLGSEYVPAWEADFLYGKMNNYETHHTGSGAAIKIPQLNAEIDYEVFTIKADPETGAKQSSYLPPELAAVISDILPFGGDAESGIAEIELMAADGTTLEIKPDYLLLELDEKNTDFMTENFELEVFELFEGVPDIQTGATTTQEIPLEFYTSGDLGPHHVEYWFNVEADENIVSAYFCASRIVADRKKNKLADAILPYPDDCPEFAAPKNLYKEQVFEQEEPC